MFDHIQSENDSLKVCFEQTLTRQQNKDLYTNNKLQPYSMTHKI